MRTATAGSAGRSLRLFLVPAAAMLAVACEDSSSPLEPPIVEEGVAASQDPVTLARDPGRWADGYLLASNPTQSFYTPSPLSSFNRAGGSITITKPAGTTGRYIATFSGLSAFLGSTSTLHVTSHGNLYGNTYCKPVDPSLARDQVEVRCYRPGTGAPVNENFTLQVTRTTPTSPLRMRIGQPAPSTLPGPGARGTPPTRPRSPETVSADTGSSSMVSSGSTPMATGR